MPSAVIWGCGNILRGKTHQNPVKWIQYLKKIVLKYVDLSLPFLTSSWGRRRATSCKSNFGIPLSLYSLVPWLDIITSWSLEEDKAQRREGMVLGQDYHTIYHCPLIKPVLLAQSCQKHADQCLKCKSGTMHGQSCRMMGGTRWLVLKVRHNVLSPLCTSGHLESMFSTLNRIFKKS